MSGDEFDLVKDALDKEIDGRSSGTSFGIKLGHELYDEFRKRKLLRPKEVDMMLWKWMAPSYRDCFVYDDPATEVWSYNLGE